jgi:hypothetical protein
MENFDLWIFHNLCEFSEILFRILLFLIFGVIVFVLSISELIPVIQGHHLGRESELNLMWANSKQSFAINFGLDLLMQAENSDPRSLNSWCRDYETPESLIIFNRGIRHEITRIPHIRFVRFSESWCWVWICWCRPRIQIQEVWIPDVEIMRLLKVS